MAIDRNAEPSVGNLIGGIVGDVQTLVRQEIHLARQETKEEIDKAKQAAIAAGTSAALLAVGGLLLVLALAQGIADLFDWPTWAGYLLVGGLAAGIGAFLFAGARKRVKDINPVPEKTVATMKENAAWIKDRTTSATT